MPEEEARKKCFVACPVDEEGSDIRKRTDYIIDKIIKPVAEDDKGYQVIAPHRDDRAGRITAQVVGHLVNDDLVIADLTGPDELSGPNPNVMYEVGIRNSVVKPIIFLCQKGHKIPFDIAESRAILLDYPDWGTIDRGKDELRSHIESAEDNAHSASMSPVTEARIDKKVFAATPLGDSEGVTSQEMARLLLTLRDEVRGIGRRLASMGERSEGLGHLSSALEAHVSRIADDAIAMARIRSSSPLSREELLEQATDWLRSQGFPLPVYRQILREIPHRLPSLAEMYQAASGGGDPRDAGPS